MPALPYQPSPTQDTKYLRRERPLSYQHVFCEFNTQPSNNYGFPEPGVQSPTAAQAAGKDFFVSDKTWRDICDHSDLDFIVIGSGFTALAFIDETLKRDPHKKILCIERGDFWLPDHFQNLPIPFKYILGGPSETFPFSLSRETYQSDVKFVHGYTPFFGGRSIFWSAWSPSPAPELMRNWPKSLLDTAREPQFFGRASELLRVTKSTEIGPPYAQLQKQIHERLSALKSVNQHLKLEVYPAPLAVSSIAKTATVRFTKFSTPGPLLSLYDLQQKHARDNTGAPLLIATNAAAQYLGINVGFPPPHNVKKDKDVKFVRTSRGDLPLRLGQEPAKVILCAGAFPNTTLLLNSFPDEPRIKKNAGSRVTGHFLSHVVARIKRSAFADLNEKSIDIGAEYVAGQHPDTKLQYHIQITAVASPDPGQDVEDAARFCPDYAASATEEQLRGSEEYVIFVCATLGELSEDNAQNFFRIPNQTLTDDPTANCVLQVLLSEKDERLWDAMDAETFAAIQIMAGLQKLEPLEWWHQPKPWDKPGHWSRELPKKETIRMEGIVHEASSLPLGEGDDYCIDTDYRVKGTTNVYVTGSAIFPTAGSWNPTLTVCGYAQDLARKLTPYK
ncbi:FAD/NAD(P)-binding domain-containing protein [Laetiporus sulphureus 93-53]|uniref:FAD/NAD(P)-binding domain-containing protein n=1 Tax=Laetiporus sulphureus 93-53 TaxID=1314785 RepID=A0A165FV13_9APHY|nr:FAD/NAD(P)-binding domain-containing protein [Laetiporus sulphureus 93-53]KZT09449.1 FAD/NAD(P)-binding domain-containing protein [Laetiporus sulphureus 93-53]